jgi:DNA-binding response OmpR family regulator
MSLPHPGPRIFVVDDEDVIASTLACILNFAGFDAAWFTNPFLALDTASSQPPDMLISDVVMPGLNGVELALQVRAQLPNCKVLLFSGQTGTPLLDRVMAGGHGFELLAKPVHPALMLEKVRAAFKSDGEMPLSGANCHATGRSLARLRLHTQSTQSLTHPCPSCETSAHAIQRES